MLPPQQARDDSLRARLAQGRDAVTRASEFRACCGGSITRSEEHTSELQSDQISYAVFCLKKKKKTDAHPSTNAAQRVRPTHRGCSLRVRQRVVARGRGERRWIPSMSVPNQERNTRMPYLQV